tara:strand:+ start:2963 stop:4126 length:1164 start_codon:yes stop_codon:yes gene_type:complete
MGFFTRDQIRGNQPEAPSQAQVQASIAADIAEGRQQAAQYGMPQRYIDKIFSNVDPRMPQGADTATLQRTPDRPISPSYDPRIPPTIISDPVTEMGYPMPPSSPLQGPIMQQLGTFQGIGSLPDPEGYAGVRSMAEGGLMFDPKNYTTTSPMAGDPFQGVQTKIISGPFGDIEVPVTYEGGTYGSSGSTFDSQGNVSGTMPIQPETFVPVEDPYGYDSPLDGAFIPSINDPVGTNNTNNTTDNTNTTDNGTTETPTTRPIPSMFGPGGFQQQTPTYPLPASEIYPNVITPVEREAVFPSYDTVGIPPTSTNPFSEPVNTIQAPPPSPFSQQTILPINLEGNDVIRRNPINLEGNDVIRRKPINPYPIVAYYQGGPVPFQQGIGSFVR